jgi:hypothetical protein
VLYLVCSYLTEFERNDVKITVLHLIDLVRAPKSKKDFDLIIDKFEKQFTNISFVRKYVTLYNDDKVSTSNKEIVKLFATGMQGWFNGRTKNPPKEIYKTLGINLPPALDIREEDIIKNTDVLRMFDSDKKQTDHLDLCVMMVSKFLLTVDRSFVAEYYNKIPFLTNLFPLTRSCISSDIIETKGWTQPCKRCWWCKEKFWAFHQYDGGTI